MNNSRNERNTTTGAEVTNTNTLTTASSIAGTAPSHTDRSPSESYRLDYFLKMPLSVEKPSNKDASSVGSTIQESARLEKTNEESQEPVAAGLTNLAVNLSINQEDDLQADNEASSIQVKQDSMETVQETSYLYYSMELCNDDTLERRLSLFNLTKEQTCAILKQITETIAYIHERKIVSSFVSRCF